MKSMLEWPCVLANGQTCMLCVLDYVVDINQVQARLALHPLLQATHILCLNPIAAHDLDCAQAVAAMLQKLLHCAKHSILSH